MKRALPLLAASMVVAASFVKTFPFSGILFGAATAILLSIPRWRSVGAQWFGRPRSLAWCLGGVVSVAAADLAISSGLITAFSHSSFGAPNLSRFDGLKGNPTLLLQWLGAIWTIVAFGEEIISRGFLIDRLLEAFGTSRTASSLAVVFSAATFGAVHYYQGVPGVAMNMATGVLYGSLYLAQRRNLWANVLVHGVTDTIALTAVYLGVMPS
jgi:membrane protease YdiL (CAAX protease family)